MSVVLEYCCKQIIVKERHPLSFPLRNDEDIVRTGSRVGASWEYWVMVVTEAIQPGVILDDLLDHWYLAGKVLQVT